MLNDRHRMIFPHARGDGEAWMGVADFLNIRSRSLFAGMEERDFNDVHRPIEHLNDAAGAMPYRAEERSLASAPIVSHAMKASS